MMPQSLNVLIIEDDPNYSDSLKKSLTDGGFCVIAVTKRAQEAIELFQKHKIDIILLDLQLEDGTGMEILHHLSNNKEVLDPYVIVITSFITKHTLKFFSENKYFYYKKNDQYHPKYILQHLNAMKSSLKPKSATEAHQNVNIKTSTEASPNNKSLINMIYHELDAYQLSPKYQAKEHLIKVIHNILTIESPTKINVSAFYTQVANEIYMDPKTISIGITRLIATAFEGENKVAAYCHFYNLTTHEVENNEENLKRPTNKDFILNVVEKINRLTTEYEKKKFLIY